MAPAGEIDPAGLTTALSHLFGGPNWEMFDAAGKLTGVIIMPPGVRVTRITPLGIFGIEKDEFDVERAVRLRLPGPQP